MSELPSAPLPEDLEQTMLAIMHDVGLTMLTKNILRKRLEVKYQIEFDSHTAEVDKVVSKLMMTPEIQLELAKIQKEKESVSAKRKSGAKRSSASEPRARKESKRESVSESKRQVKQKKPDDYPKAALTPYFHFVNDVREKVKVAHPEMKNTEILSEVGRMWKELSDDDKARYQTTAEADKKRFTEEMEAYVARGGEVMRRGSKSPKKVKKAKDPNAPKRAMSAYFFYAADYRAEHPGTPAKVQMSEAGAAWRNLSEDEKKPYEELAAKDRKRYEAEGAARGTSAGAGAEDSSSSSDSSSDSDEDN